MKRGGRRPGLSGPVAGVLGGLMLLGGVVSVAVQQAQPRFQAAGQVPVAQASRQNGGAAAAPAPSPASMATTPASSPSVASVGALPTSLGALEDHSFAPRRLRLPALGVDAPVVPVGLETDGGLHIPEDPRTVGWWSGGAAPGSPVGTVLLAGHVDSAERGPGALARLATAPVGARVAIGGPGGRAEYVVQARRRYLKTALPWRSIFAQGEVPRLVLVTCGGEFDRRTRHYTENVVVFATPI